MSRITEPDLERLCKRLLVDTTAMVAYSHDRHGTVIHDEPAERIDAIVAELGLAAKRLSPGHVKVWTP